ncbi:MAG: 2OG-Fe(II) oxygenase [Sulfuriflexus sp.]|nr:2OG-Fe(II) oxygenase [Sulfuriflexus sp.]
MAVTEYVHVRELADSAAINTAIIEQFAKYRDSEEVRRSHFFSGRYENLYLDLEHVPAMQIVLEQAKGFAADILAVTAPLKAGFWFNLMQPGHVTQEHTHDDDDECLSGVYYIETPANAGDLLITTPTEKISISPKAGQFVFFPPDIPHQVTENKSKFERLSVGMNFGFQLD